MLRLKKNIPVISGPFIHHYAHKPQDCLFYRAQGVRPLKCEFTFSACNNRQDFVTMCSSWTKICASSHRISAMRLYAYQGCNVKMTARCRGGLDNRTSCSPISTRQYRVPAPPHHCFTALLNWMCTPSSCQSIPTSSPAVCQKQTCKIPTRHLAWTRFDLVPASL